MLIKLKEFANKLDELIGLDLNQILQSSRLILILIQIKIIGT